MKQSKKLLSIFLAMLMLLGTVSVVGNAALAKDQVAYDSIDNAKFTPEQVAGIVLDMLDNDLLAGMDTIDLSIIGKLRLNKVDYIFEDICSLRGGFVWAIGSGLLGDVGKLNFNALKKGDWDEPYQRSDGNLTLLYQLLQFIADNAGTLSKVAYGIGTDNGLSLGLIGSFLSLGDIEDILADLPGFLTRMVYDMLIYGSYGYDKDAEELGNKLPTEADTLDEIVNVAIKGLLTKPQKYDWVPTGSVDAEGNPVSEKKWDEDSFILNASKLEGKNLDLSQNSFFTLLDTILPVAYETFGTVVLNHDVKKIFMEAMGANFVRVTDAKEIATIKADSDYVDVEKDGVDTSSVKNYFCNAQMWKVGNDWYFRDYVTTEIGTDATTGEPITEKQHRYFKAETYNVDELFEVFNWDYYLTANSIDFTAKIQEYGSLAGCLNHIIHVILKNAISSEFLAKKGTSIDALWADGGNDKFNENLMNTAKFLLINYTFMFFGRNEAYVDLDTLEAKPEFIQKVNSFKNDDNGREGLIAYMLLPLLGDVLPQLVYSADMFEDGLQIEQVAALLVREFVTDLTPQVNDYVCDYDALIFQDSSLKTGRTLVKGKDSAYWMNIVLNMGLDLAAIYLDNITNFGVDLASLKTLHSYASGSTQPWQIVLEEIVDWAVLYIGDGANSVIKGLDPNTLGVSRSVSYTPSNDSHTVANNYDGKAFWRLSTALNTLLPLGIVNGCSSAEFGLDVEVLFNKIKNDIIPSLNIEGIIGLFGRNNHESNFLGQTNLYKEVLDLVNQLLSAILGNNILVVGTNASTILANAISQGSLKTTVNSLLTGLNSRKQGLLVGVLPVLAAFISDWGGEQSLASPDLSISETTKADAGNLDVTLALRNGSKGIWRSYMQNGSRVQDEQYSYDVKSIVSLQGVGISGGTGALAYGTTASVKFTKSGMAGTGIADRIDITYTVSDENGNLMANGNTFTKSYFTYFSYDNDLIMNERHGSSWGNDMNADMPKYLYYAEEDLPNISSNECFSYYNEGGSSKTGKITGSSGTQNGITLNNISVSAKEGSSTAAPFSFDPNSYTSVGHAGAAYTYSYKMDNGNDDDSFSSTLFVYSGADYGLLEGLVEDEVGKNRVLADYNDDGSKYNAYLGALANGMAVIYNPRVDGNFWTDCYARYEALKSAVEALEAVEKTDAEKAAAGGSIDGLVDNLKTQLDGIQKNFDGKDYRTYMLYRWERYKSARSDANWIINLKEEVKFGAPTKHFPYGGYSQAQYTNIVGNDKYKDFLLALLVDMTDEELANAKENYDNRSAEYYSQTTLDVAQYSNLLTRMSQRLITRTTKPVTSYLQKEIDSAKKDIGTAKGNYSDKSWAPYADALSNAEAALSSGSQDVIFAAKYALQVARNNLRTATQEADYTELNTLIAQAEGALAARSSYKNLDVDFGKLLMALGYTTESGTKLFGGAKDVVNYSYDKHDQDEVDDAADELKAVLAELEFNDFGTKKPASVVSTDVDTGAKDENDQPIKENMYTAKIGAEQVKEQVAKALAVSGCTVEVSLDEKYTAASDANLDKIPVGTGATVTILQKVGGVDVPVATIKLIVEGDVTGDGVIDTLDCMIADIVKNGDADLTGLYYIAGNLSNDTAFDINDVNAIVNKAIPDKIA
ncbi:MAG: hypothetical protein IJC90_09130 [Clostridia bacterium]|nr:hypothetical protein [Clostridia bacterium]